MKKTLLILSTGFLSFVANSQWSNGGGFANGWGNSSSGPIFTQWRSFGFGNFAANGATPQARVHINEFYLLNPWTGTNGNILRTDGSNTVNNNWRMFTGPTAAGATEKFRITSLATSSQIELGTVQNGSLHLLTNNTRRVTVLNVSNFPYNRNGFVGLNDENPRFNLDINTQNPGGAIYGELMLRARITDDPFAYISFVNIATTGAFLAPALLGRQSNNPQAALNTVGSIHNDQDIAANIQPITRFYSVTNYDPTGGPVTPPLSFDRSNVVENRRLFGWYNGVDQLMTMESNGFLGIGINNPGNRVEINSDFYDLNTGGPLGIAPNGPSITQSTDNGQSGLGATNATGFSGLRFSDLTSNSNPLLLNPGLGVLALDANGDVVYVNGTSIGNGLGNYCTQPQNGLLSDYEIPLNNFNYYFSGQGNVTRTVGIGLACNEPTFAKLHVRQQSQNFLITSTLGISAAGYFHNIANSSIVAYGAIGSSNGNNTINIGVYGEANGAAVNYAGYFEGDVYINSINISGTGYVLASDEQFKTDVNELESALPIIEQLNAKTYFLDTLNQYGIKFSGQKQYGFIAQEVESVVPELVSQTVKPQTYDSLGNLLTDSVSYKSLNYNGIIPILVKGIQEQQQELDHQDSIISALNNRLIQLENCLSNLLPALCQANQMAIQQTPEETQEYLEKTINVTLSSRNNIILNQNVPNPFAESTVITYTIPATVQKAQIHFYDGQGKLINSVEIAERGNGQLNVFANDLSTGVYTYSLVADGKVVATKKMMKQ